MLMAIEKWRYYQEGRRFTTRTNHENLKFISQQRAHNQLQRKGITKLMGFDYVIQYRKGKENLVADTFEARASRSTKEKHEKKKENLTKTLLNKK